MKTTPIGPFLGINNRLPDTALHVDKKGDFLPYAENVDVDNAGNLRRRESELQIQAMLDGHSLHMTSATTGYLMRGSSLYAITLPAYGQSFVKLLSNSDPVCWLEVGDSLYYSNGTDSGRIAAGTFYPIGLPTPAAPSCSVLPGAMFAGTYKVAVSYYNSSTKEEGGVSAVDNPVLAAAGGLRVPLPGVTDGATHINVYLSSVNGSKPMWVGSYATGTAYVDFVAMPAQHQEAAQRFEVPLPAGKLFMANGRLCSIVGRVIFVGLPHRYGYYDVAGGWIVFNEDVSIAIANQNGTYIAADKTYFVPGDLGNVEGALDVAFPYGAVPGTEFRNDDNTAIGWFGRDGYVIAAKTGEVTAVMADNIDLVPPVVGCSLVRSTNGYTRVIGSGWCLNLENGAATEYAGFSFTSLSGNYGIKADGLYALSGGPDIDWMAGMGKQNFGAEQRKRMPAIYLGGSSPEPLSVRIQTDEDDDYTYEARSCSDTVKLHRVDPGLGLESNWFDLELIGRCNFTLASVSFAPAVSGRRI